MASVLLDQVREHNGGRIPPPPFPPGAPSPGFMGDKGDDPFDLLVPADTMFTRAEVMFEDGRYRAGARLRAHPAPATLGPHVRVEAHWYFDGGLNQSFVRYRVRAYGASCVAPERWVRGFWPSSHGLHFVNNFPSLQISVAVPLPAGGTLNVPLQNSFHGACGGMAFSVRDHFEAGYLLPPDRNTPASGGVHDYIVQRLLDSFNLPNGPQNYLRLMDPLLPDGDVPGRRGRNTILLEAWDSIRRDIDAGNLAALGLVLVKTPNAARIFDNHQVLAWGYSDHGGRCGTLFLYDPNFPDDDRVTLTFRIDDPNGPATLRGPYPAIHGFFHNPYARRTPPEPARTVRATLSLRAMNGSHLTAVGGGGADVRATAGAVGPAERFRVEETSADPLRNGDLVYLRAQHDQYLVAESGGGSVLNANRATPRQWERFVLRETFGAHVDPHDGWRPCARCGSVVFTRVSEAGRCAAGGVHDVRRADEVWLLRGSGAVGEHGWRRCHRCEALFSGAAPGVNACVAGGAHEPLGDDYVVSLAAVAHGSDGWRRCARCRTVWKPGSPDACPAGGHHDPTGSPNYWLSAGLRGDIPSGALVTVRGCNGQYVVAEHGGGGVVNVNRDAALEWETFRATVTP